MTVFQQKLLCRCPALLPGVQRSAKHNRSLSVDEAAQSVNSDKRAFPDKVRKALSLVLNDESTAPHALHVLLPLQAVASEVSSDTALLRGQTVSLALLAYRTVCKPKADGAECGNTNPIKNVVNAIEATMGWWPGTCRFLGAMPKANAILQEWLYSAEVLEVCSFTAPEAAQALLDPDAYALVHQCAFARKLRGTNDANERVAEYRLQMNAGLLKQLLGRYLDREAMADSQPEFALVDWARACLLVAIALPHAAKWVTESVNHRLLVYDTAWDVACVLGQMPVSRPPKAEGPQRKFKRGTPLGSRGCSPRDERARVALELEGARLARQHSAEMRTQDTTLARRDSTVALLVALLTQRRDALDDLFLAARTDGVDVHTPGGDSGLTESPAAQGVSRTVSRLSGRFGPYHASEVVWPKGFTAESLEGVCVPFLHHWATLAAGPMSTLLTSCPASPSPSALTPALSVPASTGLRLGTPALESLRRSSGPPADLDCFAKVACAGTPDAGPWPDNVRSDTPRAGVHPTSHSSEY